MSSAVHVRTPCRLHFGMFSFGRTDQREFGGVGVMVEPSNVQVDISRSDRFAVSGPFSGRVSRFVNEIAKNWKLESLPACSIEVRSPPDHTGLGIGTQLGLAVASGLRRFLRLSELPLESLATSAGRGGRSAVGTYGFARGGLIVDAGKRPGEVLGKLCQRVELPFEWRFILVRHNSDKGMAGAQEVTAFAGLPPVPEATTRALWRLVTEQMIPAIESADCTAFGDAVCEFGRLAGTCFATAQGGPFATPAVERLVHAIRDFGVAGVGQSSWGPTVFAAVPSENDAGRLVEWLRNQPAVRDCEITVAKPNNSGAQVLG